MYELIYNIYVAATITQVAKPTKLIYIKLCPNCPTSPILIVNHRRDHNENNFILAVID